jgi:hypothetical protein
MEYISTKIFIFNNYLLVASPKIDISNEAESLLGWLIKEESATYVYYHARRSTIELHYEKVKNENKKLKEKLSKKRDIERKKKFGVI